MKVLIIGSGGREHTLAWKIFQSERVEKIYVAPGNDGMSDLAERVPIQIDQIEELANWALANKIDLTVVGPEDPLVNGIVDHFEAKGLRIFGPNKEAALLEGSKVFAKSILKKYDIPTAEFEVFTDPDAALNYLEEANYPLVIKAEGLAGGKGVVIASKKEEANAAVERIMEDKVFGDAGDRIVIEDFLEGQEISVLALTDGEHILPLAPAQDHKAIFDGDEGPNTGGMGAYSPTSFMTDDLWDEVCEDILEPTVKALKEEGVSYKGVLYAGLILTDTGMEVLEFNARFGDPETQVILPRLEDDLVELMELVIDGRLSEKKSLSWDERAAVCVVLASGGYPLTYETGFEIKGLDDLKQHDNLLIFHSGTKLVGDKWFTDGGRVLGITVLGDGILDAINQVYDFLEEIEFEDIHYRTDIGFKIIED